MPNRHQMRPAKIIRRLFASSLILVSIWLGSWAFAELLAIGPRNLLSEAATARVLPKNKDWLSAYNLLTYSSQLKPYDANMQFELGRIAWIQATSLNISEDEKTHWLKQSASHLNKAITDRPTWGRAWAEISAVYIQQKKNLKAYKALIKAMKLEPYEGYSQKMILWSGFALWPMLIPEDKEKFLTVVKHVLTHSDARRVIDTAVANGRENVIKPYFDKDSKKYRYLLKGIIKRDSQPQ